MALCLICLNETDGYGKRYCHACAQELDERYTKEWAKTKSDIHKKVLNQLIVEHAAKRMSVGD